MTSVHTDDDRRITYFAATHTRGKREMFGIRGIDRGKHIYVIGKTGMGKSTMLENMAIQDIQNGEGIAFIDPHGSTAEKLLDFIPHERIKDVVYFAPFDTDHPIGFNVMEDVGYDKRHLVVSGLMGALKRIWVDAWSARMEYILQNTLLALLEYPDSTLLDVNRMLTNKTFRAAVVAKITDPIVKGFWVEEFAAFTDTYTREATPAIQNKIGQFTANPLIRNIVGQGKSSFDLRKIMDDKKIFIVNLSKGRMGETNASLLGSMLVVKIYLAAMSRADEPAARMARLPRFYFYVDEFQSMMNEAFADILSESRKYKLALTLANQYIEQMEEEVRDAVFGNVGTLIVFRVGPFDAEVLETVFDPTFTPEDLVGLGIGQIYLTLMIDGVGSKPFSAETIPPIDTPPISYRDDCIQSSRELYGRARAEIEAAVNQKQLDFQALPKEKKEREKSTYGSRPRPSNAAPRGFVADRPREAPAVRKEPLPASPNSADRYATHTPTASPEVGPSRPPRFGEAGRSGAEAEQRSALRAAIAQARPATPEAPVHSAPIRSPADILRERRAMKQQPATPHAAHHAARAGHSIKPPHIPNPQPHARPVPRQDFSSDNGANDTADLSPQAGEVSPEVLKQVLRGEGSNE
ncbi:type IV secretion system DNA-binding domain-containing protein [Candidatus Kaiserbacteria bacterium]|nr:type IV secretion system DNA-binding domain-containing protein [Candidatus Kaiserbacteria bacterium]